MSPKVRDGLYLNSYNGHALLKRPGVGGYFLSGKDLSGFYQALNNPNRGWGWATEYDKNNEGAALVAPLLMLYWEKYDG